MRRLLSQLLSPESHIFWRSHVCILQLLQEVAVVAQGQLLSLTAMVGADLAAHKLPHHLQVGPLCLVAGQPTELQLSGMNISSPDCTLVVKGNGSHLHLAGMGISSGCGPNASCCNCAKGGVPGAPPAPSVTTAATDAALPSADIGCGRENVECVVTPAAGRCGVLWVEVARGAFTSESRPLLVVDDPLLAQVRAWGSGRAGQGAPTSRAPAAATTSCHVWGWKAVRPSGGLSGCEECWMLPRVQCSIVCGWVGALPWLLEVLSAPVLVWAVKHFATCNNVYRASHTSHGVVWRCAPGVLLAGSQLLTAAGGQRVVICSGGLPAA
jgi:hypothetical protein